MQTVSRTSKIAASSASDGDLECEFLRVLRVKLAAAAAGKIVSSGVTSHGDRSHVTSRKNYVAREIYGKV